MTGRRIAHARCQHDMAVLVALWAVIWLALAGLFIWAGVGIGAVYG